MTPPHELCPRKRHPLTPDNVVVVRRRGGRPDERRCRACQRATAARIRADRRRERLAAHTGHQLTPWANGGVHCLTCRRGVGDIDQVAVYRAVTGDPPPGLTWAERSAAIAILTDRGWSARRTGLLLRITTRTVERHRAAIRQAEAA